MNKKHILVSLLASSAILVAGCSVISPKTDNKSTDTVQTSKENDEVSEKEQAKKDAKIVLNALFSDSSAGFNSLMGEDVKEWKERITDDYVDEEKGKYTPAADYSITIGNEEFTPEKILTLFDETRWSIFASIGTDYEINDVEINGDTATVNFTSRAIATKDLANTITLIKTNLFADGLAGVDAAGDSTDETTQNANTILNDFLFYWAFDREYLDFGYIEPREYSLILEKDKDGRWVITDDNLLELRRELFVQEYSADGAEMRSDNSSTKKNTDA